MSDFEEMEVVNSLHHLPKNNPSIFFIQAAELVQAIKKLSSFTKT